MLLAAALGWASTAALAFQETKGGVTDGQQPAAGHTPGKAAPTLDLKDTGVSVAPPGGVEVRIPGLGKLGVLPKFDFGLELLYGVNEQKAGDTERQLPASPSDDVQIRGSLKHRF
jgi:hypothetical protein